jgi:hypothetical protein
VYRKSNPQTEKREVFERNIRAEGLQMEKEVNSCLDKNTHTHVHIKSQFKNGLLAIGLTEHFIWSEFANLQYLGNVPAIRHPIYLRAF